MILFKKYRIEKRLEIGIWSQIASAIIALLIALLITAVLVTIAGGDWKDAFISLFSGAFGDKDAALESLVRSTPLILTGLAAAIAFRGKIWNIGAEGQFFVGAIGAYWAYITFKNLPTIPLLILIFIAGCAAGGLTGLLAGVLKAYFNVDEIITTVMMNYIINYMLALILSGPWKEAGSVYRHTPPIEEFARLPILFPGSRLNLGFILALLAAGLFYFILKKTPLGYEIRAMGSNLEASKFKGISVSRVMILTLLLSGAVAGLSGVIELFGSQYRIRMDLSVGYGFTGIIVALLGGLNPLAIIPSGILLGGLLNGSVRMQIITKVPTALISAVQAIILMFLLASQAVARYRIRRIDDV
jgi:simple sugar transport system permease protein